MTVEQTGYVVERQHPSCGYVQFWRDGGWRSKPPVGLFADRTTAEKYATNHGGTVRRVQIRAINEPRQE